MSGGTITTPVPESSAQAPTPSGGEELILGKFKDQAALEAAYQELERKQSGQAAPEPKPAPKPDEGAAPAAEPTAEEAATQALQVAGLDMAEFTQEFAKDGKLSEASYGRLAAAGFPKAVVDQYIRGGQAQTLENDTNRAAENKAVAEAGIEDATPLLAWASSNLKPQEIAAFNRIMDSGDHAAMVWALGGLKTRYTKAMGSDPNLINGGGPAGPVDIYESSAQVVADMKKPEYKTDPAFREAVKQKLGRSNVFKRPGR